MLEEAYTLALWNSPARAPVELSVPAPQSILDKAVGHAYGSDTSALPVLGPDLEAFGNWSSVASTLYTKLYQITGFDPSSTIYSGSSFASLRYSFSTSPFWNTQFSISTADVIVRHSDYGHVATAVNNFCRKVGLAAEISEQILKNAGQIAHCAATQDGPQQKRSLLQNGTIAAWEGLLHVALIYATVSMEMRPAGRTYRVLNQQIQMVFGHGVLDFDFCKRRASSILQYDHVNLDDWKTVAAANSEPDDACGGWL
jgi:hypothetical protein